jgi:hypothetical protein
MKNYFIVFVFVIASNMIWGQCAGTQVYGVSITNATCNGGLGSAQALINSINCACTGPWRYVLCNATGTPIAYFPSSTTYTTSTNPPAFLNLPLNSYQMKFVTAAFPTGCPNSTINFTIGQPDPISGTVSSFPTSCSTTTDGSIIVNNIQGGILPYNISWTGPVNGNPAGDEVLTNTDSYVINNLLPGDYIITITDFNGCSNSTYNMTVSSSGTNATISYATPFCSTDGTTFVTLTGTGSYTTGAYSSVPTGLTLNTSTGEITPNTSTPGTYTVTYTIPAFNGCPAVSATTTVTITPLPTATITYSSTNYCTSISTGQSPTLTGTGAYTVGTYSATPAGLTINATTGAIIPSTSTAGVYTVSYTLPAAGGCPPVVATFPITITQQPTATISYASPFCSTDGTTSVTLTGTGAYTTGTYSSVPIGLTLDGTTGYILPNTSVTGTYTVTYTIPASNGCSAVTATASVTITLSPTALMSYLSANFCTSTTASQPVVLTGTGAYTTGTYSASPGGITLDASTGTIIPNTSAPGSYTVAYTIPSAAGCTAVTATANVTVTELPTATISYSGPYCTSLTTPQAVNLSGTGNFTVGSYSSSSGLALNTSTGAITPNTSTLGTYTVTYTIPASNGCSAVTSTSGITINTPPAASISYASPFCSSQFGNQAVFLSGVGDYTGGWFTSNPSGLTLNSNTGMITPNTSIPGLYTVFYYIPPVNGCASVTTSTEVSIYSSLSITGNTAICIGYSNQLTSSETNGIWTSNNLSIAVVDNSGIVTGITAGTTTITFTNDNGCSITEPLIVHNLPTVVLSSFNDLCDSLGLVSLSGGEPLGGIYSGTSVSNNEFNTIIGVGSYVITYSYSDQNGCSSSSSQQLNVIECSGASIIENNDNNTLIFPNPTFNTFSILEDGENHQLFSIYDQTGRVIFNGKLNGQITTVDLSNFSNGLYVLKIDGNDKRFQIVKE